MAFLLAFNERYILTAASVERKEAAGKSDEGVKTRIKDTVYSREHTRITVSVSSNGGRL